MDVNNDQEHNYKKIGKYYLAEIIGKGQFATVRLGIDSESNKVFAVKCQSKKLTQENEQYKKLLISEIKIMFTINHPNIIHLYELLESGNNYYLIIDYCNNGDLQTYLNNRKSTHLPEKDAIYFLKQIINGFKELRNHKIMHRDLKLENILVHDDTIKIADFGMAKIGHNIANSVVGSFLTMAPELFMDNLSQGYTSKADLWSIGFIYYQILFGEYPFHGLTPNEIACDIRAKSGNLKFSTPISAASQDLINRLLVVNPDNRIDWPEVFNHPLFVFNFPRSLRDFVKKQTDEEMIDTSAIKVDAEFAKNKIEILKQKSAPEKDKERPKTPQNQKRPQSIPKLEHENSKNGHKEKSIDKTVVKEVQNINEEIPTESDITKLQKAKKCSEVDKRYKHEKQKISFLIYVVRGIRKLSKISAFSKINEEMFMMALLISKKAILLNDSNIISLKYGKNIFEEHGFDDLIKSTDLHPVLELFTKQKSSYENYLNYLLDKVKETQLDSESQAIIGELKTEYVSLSSLDLKINVYYNKVINFEVKPSEPKHEFVLMMVCIFYAVNCEVYLPYKLNGQEFNWDDFYELHENMTDEYLWKIISN